LANSMMQLHPSRALCLRWLTTVQRSHWLQWTLQRLMQDYEKWSKQDLTAGEKVFCASFEMV
jgi:hypothetical protein